MLNKIQPELQRTRSSFKLVGLPRERTCRQEALKYGIPVPLTEFGSSPAPDNVVVVLKGYDERTVDLYNGVKKTDADRLLTHVKKNRKEFVNLLRITTGAFNFLFHGYDWPYTNDCLRIQATSEACKQYVYQYAYTQYKRTLVEFRKFRINCHILASQAVLQNTATFHGFLGMVRDAYDFAMARHSCAALLDKRWTPEEVFEIYKSGNKQQIKAVIRQVVKSLSYYRKNVYNSPFSPDFVKAIQFMLDNDLNYKAFHRPNGNWQTRNQRISDIMWWESSHGAKFVGKYRKPYMDYIYGKAKKK